VVEVGNLSWKKQRGTACVSAKVKYRGKNLFWGEEGRKRGRQKQGGEKPPVQQKKGNSAPEIESLGTQHAVKYGDREEDVGKKKFGAGARGGGAKRMDRSVKKKKGQRHRERTINAL